MRFYLIIIVFGLITCTSKKKDNGGNLVVMRNDDTLSHFYYENEKFEKYTFLDRQDDLDNIIESKAAQLKLMGKFHFGIKDRTNTLNQLLAFSGVPIDKFEITSEAQMPFLKEEFNIERSYAVVLLTNYIDSLSDPIRKTEIQVAIDKLTKDTLIYQESSYAFKKPEHTELVLTLLIYDKSAAREEMLEFLNETKEKINLYSSKTSRQ